jgi:hypothetical protein
MLMLILSTSYPALRGFHSGGGITYKRKTAEKYQQNCKCKTTELDMMY